MGVDLELMNLLNVSLQAVWLDPIMWALTIFSLPGLAVVPVVLHRRGRKREALLLALVMLTSGLLAVEIQFIALRPRPDAARLLLAPPPFPSFPSGHAAIAFGWATFLVLRFQRGGPLIVAAAVALSRVYVGHHFPSDVLLGAILGGATGAVAFGCFFGAGVERPRWAWWIWAQLAVVLFAGLGAYLGLTDFSFLKYPYADKVLHFVLFGALSFFLVAWFSRTSAVLVTALFLGVAALDEVAQLLSPLRTFDLLDLTCTVLGIVAFAGLGRLAVRATSGWPSGRSLDRRHYSEEC